MKKLAIIGAGSMAEALISGIVENNLVENSKIWVTNRSNEQKLKDLHDKYGVSISYDQKEILENAEIVILAMKPKDVAAAINQIKLYLTDKMLIVSLLAGVSIHSIELLADRSIPVVRAMPNTSSAIGQSATALAGNEKVTNEQMEQVQKMFNTVGLTALVKEEQLDAVTGLSGSGPAYIYYLVEAMEESAIEIGLEKELAHELIVQTLLGAAGMLAKAKKSPEQLRKEVTSPGGTTEAGLKVLKAHGVQEAFNHCIKEAAAQSKRLGNALTEEINTAKEKMAGTRS